MKSIKYINAGAGSGKTYYLTDTFAEHVKNGDCTPSEVIMATFSEKAAADIKRNARTRFLERGLQTEAAQLDTASIGTIHSIAYKYIKKYWYLLGISARCEVMTDDNKEGYISSTLGNATSVHDIEAFQNFAKTMDLKAPKSTRYDYDFWKKAATDIISKADGLGISCLDESHDKSLELIDHVCKPHEHFTIIRDCADRIFEIAKRWGKDFAKYKTDNSLIDYNDMEILFLKILKEQGFEDARKDISESVKYVFVDEFQDSNPKQLEIFDLLSDLVVRSYWVGDPKQAIYGFRACDTDLVQALADKIKSYANEGIEGFMTDRLKVSRRSLKPLVEFSNKVFEKIFPEMDPDDVSLNPYRKENLPDGIPNLQHWDGPLQLGETNKNGKPGTPTLPNKGETITALASEIRKIIDGKSSIKEIFDKDDSKLRAVRPSDIAILCRTNTDVYSIAGELKKYGIPVSLQSVADASKMEVRFVLLMLNYILGKEKLLTAELAKVCCDQSLSDIINKDYADIEKITAFLDSFRVELSHRSVSSMVRGIIIRMGLLDDCALWGDYDNRRNNLMALINNAKDYENSCLTLGRSATVEGFIAEIEDGNIVVNGYSEGVNIVTYHGSKGLQWPLVFMFSLTNDLLTDKQIYKSYLWDVRHIRKATPSADNLYTGYYLTYVPKLTNQYNAGLPKDMESAIGNITGIGDYYNYRESVIREGRRLLYVAVTRARDIFVEIGQHKENIQLTEALKDLYEDKHWKSRTEKDWQNGTYHEIWGPSTTLFYYREMTIAPAPEDHTAKTYLYKPKVESDMTETVKKISPSSLTDEALVDKVLVEPISNDGEFRQIIISSAKGEDDKVGSCIHDIFAAYNPEKSRDQMIALSERLIERHYLKSALKYPDKVIDSADSLYAFLEKKFGRAVRIEHEFPFCEMIEGQTIVGSMDLVWFISEKECVLVDFKNLPGATRQVLKSEDKRFLGHYAPQLNAYRRALERAGFIVRETIIYLAMQAEVIKLIY